jgi:hypothetical protein
MVKYLSIILIFGFTLNSCGQAKRRNAIIGLTINKHIKSEVEKHIANSKEFDAFKDKMQVYANSVFIQSYENDSLTFNSSDTANKQIFKSFYLWQGDTLKIDGAFGLFTGVGFEIVIYKNKAILYHMLSSDDFPTYAYKENDSLKLRLEVPCTETKIILSEIPDSNRRQIIYGYVEFKSKNYYLSNGSVDGKEILPRKKQRDNMKIYFKSAELNLQEKPSAKNKAY